MTGKKSKIDKSASEKTVESSETFISEDRLPADSLLWLNALIGRVLFDCIRDPVFAQRVKDRIQRKLASIKLPYFIEELSVTELTLGQTPPLLHKAGKPNLDERGLWVDLDVSYEGLVVLILRTKLNLMKLKEPHVHGKYLKFV